MWEIAALKWLLLALTIPAVVIILACGVGIIKEGRKWHS